MSPKYVYSRLALRCSGWHIDNALSLPVTCLYSIVSKLLGASFTALSPRKNKSIMVSPFTFRIRFSEPTSEAPTQRLHYRRSERTRSILDDFTAYPGMDMRSSSHATISLLTCRLRQTTSFAHLRRYCARRISSWTTGDVPANSILTHERSFIKRRTAHVSSKLPGPDITSRRTRRLVSPAVLEARS
jgi:hypothetical protein